MLKTFAVSGFYSGIKIDIPVYLQNRANQKHFKNLNEYA